MGRTTIFPGGNGKARELPFTPAIERCAVGGRDHIDAAASTMEFIIELSAKQVQHINNNRYTPFLRVRGHHGQTTNRCLKPQQTNKVPPVTIFPGRSCFCLCSSFSNPSRCSRGLCFCFSDPSSLPQVLLSSLSKTHHLGRMSYVIT